MAGALDGVVVVSLEQAVAAPFLTCRMADAGARVIKLERAEGDFARGYDDTANGQSSFFVWLNRGKESLVVDIKQEEDRALLKRMLAKADVWVQNLAPGATERAGFGSEALREAFPRLITVDISGYGEAPAPFDTAKAYDLLVQAESGLMDVTGSAAEPSRVGISACDLTTGINGLTGVLQALYQREKTGVGAGVEVSMFDAMADLMAAPVMFKQYGDRGWPRTGLRHNALVPYGAYATGDGRLTMIAIQNEREWGRFAEIVLEKPEFATDERCAPNRARMANREFVEGAMDQIFNGLTQEVLQARLRTADIAYSSVNTVDDMVKHPALRRTEVQTANGPISMPARPSERLEIWQVSARRQTSMSTAPPYVRNFLKDRKCRRRAPDGVAQFRPASLSPPCATGRSAAPLRNLANLSSHIYLMYGAFVAEQASSNDLLGRVAC